jgi:hypothetical protein
MGHPDDPISAPSRQRLRELDQLLVKAVADMHGPATLVERLASASRLLGLLLLLLVAWGVDRRHCRPRLAFARGCAISGPGGTLRAVAAGRRQRRCGPDRQAARGKLRLHTVLRSQRWPLPPRLKTYATSLRETALREGEIA